MATAAQWLEGARPRTLPAAVSPVVAGTAVALHAEVEVWWKAALALVVALALQVGVTTPTTTPTASVAPTPTGSARCGSSAPGSLRPSQVKAAAFAAFGVAAVAGLVLALTSAWWLVLVGVLAILAAWYYTGGSRPYGYAGLGEVMVFVFFGLVAVVGDDVRAGRPVRPARARLRARRRRDRRDGLRAAGGQQPARHPHRPRRRQEHPRRTAGRPRHRTLYIALVYVAAIAVVVLAALTTWWALLGLAGIGVANAGVRVVVSGAVGESWCRCCRAPAWASWSVPWASWWACCWHEPARRGLRRRRRRARAGRRRRQLRADRVQPAGRCATWSSTAPPTPSELSSPSTPRRSRIPTRTP